MDSKSVTRWREALLGSQAKAFMEQYRDDVLKEMFDAIHALAKGDMTVDRKAVTRWRDALLRSRPRDGMQQYRNDVLKEMLDAIQAPAAD